MAYQAPSDGSSNASYFGQLYVDQGDADQATINFTYDRDSTEGADEVKMDAKFQEFIDYLEQFPAAKIRGWWDGEVDGEGNPIYQYGPAVQATKRWPSGQDVTPDTYTPPE